MRTRERIILIAAIAAGVLITTALVYSLYSGDEGDGAKPLGGEDAALGGSKAELYADEAGGTTSDIENAGLEKVSIDGPAEKAGKARAAAAAATGKGAISGIVLAEQAGGLGGAEVRFSSESGSSSFFGGIILDSDGRGSGSEKEHTCLTGPDGRFSLEGLPEAENGALIVSHANYVSKRLPLGRYGGDAKDVGSVVLELGASVSGYVRTAEGGMPIPGAIVTATKADNSLEAQGAVFIFSGGGSVVGRTVEGETDANGHYVLMGVPAGEVVVTADHEDHPASKRQKMPIAKGDARSGVDFALEPGLSISGLVTDLDGKPLAGIRVSTRRDVSVDLLEGVNTISRRKSAVTSADGTFTINGLAKGKYIIRASGGIYLPESLAGVETGARKASIRLRIGGRVQGRVTDAKTGEPVESFGLKVSRGQFGRSFSGNILKGEEAAARIGAGTEPAGAFLVEGVGEDALTFTFSADGYADVEMDGITAVPGQNSELSCSLVPESRVSGRVLSPEGEGLAGCTLTLREKPEGGGAGNTAGLEIRKVGIRAGGDGMQYISDGSEWTKSVESASDGRFLFKGIPEGEYTLEANHGDFVAPAPLDVSVVEGGRTAGLEIAMSAGGGIAGTVFGEDGEPLAGARVRARGVGGFAHESATADIDGAYAFKGLAPGEYGVTLGKEEGGAVFGAIVIAGSSQAPPGEQRVIVEEGKIVELDLYDVPGGIIAGYVTEAGNPVQGMKVQLFQSEGFAFMALKTATTDRDGGYVLDDVRPGSYKVRLGISGTPEPIEETVSVFPGGRLERDFELPSGRVSGVVTDGVTGEPIAGIVISLEKPSTEERTTQSRMISMAFSSFDDSGAGDITSFTLDGSGGTVTTGKDGRYEIRYVREGEYRLVASGAGYMEGALEPVTVKEGEESTGQDLVLTTGAVIAGKVVNVATGEALQHVPVQLQRLDENGAPDAGRNEVNMSQGDGAFRFKGLDGGRYRLSSMDGSYSGEIEVDVKAGETADGVVLRVAVSG